MTPAQPAFVLKKLREMCLSLPDTRETLTWGEPHFRVGDKIFLGFGEEKGRPVISFKVTMDHQDALIMQDRFRVARYVGRHGWVTMDAARIEDWDEVGELVLESYRLIAPKRSWARLDAAESPPRGTRKSGPRPKRSGARTRIK